MSNDVYFCQIQKDILSGRPAKGRSAQITKDDSMKIKICRRAGRSLWSAGSFFYRNWILRYTVEPFSKMTPEEIIPYIETEPQISRASKGALRQSRTQTDRAVRSPLRQTGEQTGQAAGSALCYVGAQGSDTPPVNTGKAIV